MFKKRRHLICGFAVTGTQGTGPAATHSTLAEHSLASHPDRTERVAARRARLLAPQSTGAARAAHCTDIRHGTVRGRSSQVCLARADRAPLPFACRRRCGQGDGACVTGMDSTGESIFIRSRIPVMEPVRHTAAGMPPTGDRTMNEPKAREARLCDIAWTRRNRPEPAGPRRAVPETAGRVFRHHRGAGNKAWRGATRGGAEALLRREMHLVGARSVRGGGGRPNKRATTTGCSEIQVLRGGSARCPLARDNE